MASSQEAPEQTLSSYNPEGVWSQVLPLPQTTSVPHILDLELTWIEANRLPCSKETEERTALIEAGRKWQDLMADPKHSNCPSPRLEAKSPALLTGSWFGRLGLVCFVW